MSQRIRTIKPDVLLDDGLANVSIEAHFLLIGLPCLADREGRLEDRPLLIRSLIFPYRPTVNVDACLSELQKAGRVVRYDAGGHKLIQILEWDRDQRPHKRESPSKLPPIPDNYTKAQPSPDQGQHMDMPASNQGLEQPGGIRDLGSGIRDLGSKSSGPAAPPATRSAHQVPLVDVPVAPKKTNAAGEFHAWARSKSRPKLAPDAPDNCTLAEGQWPRLSMVLKEHGVVKVQAAFEKFMADEYALSRGLPLGLFVGQWERWVGAVTAAPIMPKPTRAPAPGTKWTEEDVA